MSMAAKPRASRIAGCATSRAAPGSAIPITRTPTISTCSVRAACFSCCRCAGRRWANRDWPTGCCRRRPCPRFVTGSRAWPRCARASICANGSRLSSTPSGAQPVVVGPGGVIGLQGREGPVEHRVPQRRIARASHTHRCSGPGAFTARVRDGRDATQSPQSVVVSCLEGRPGSCEHNGGDDPSDTWQGEEDLHVAVLALLPLGRLRLRGGREC